MHIRYIREMHVPGLGEWSDASAGDWLHPYHGPLPDRCGLVACGPELFIVALWISDAIIAFVTLVWEDSSGPEEPAQEPPLRGAIPMTYRWVIDDDELRCCNQSFPLPTDDVEETWKSNVSKQVMEESVLLTITQPMGTVMESVTTAEKLRVTTSHSRRQKKRRHASRTTSAKRRSR